jgi:DNA gyrase subunit A
MPDASALDRLPASLDYDKLIERASPALQLYIRNLEQDNARLRQEMAELQQSIARRERAAAARESRAEAPPAEVETVCHPDDVMVVTLTARGQCKRTPLNDYSAQRRGGVGVFDILTSRDDLAAHILIARAGAHLLALTSQGRAFRLPVDSLPLTEVRGRGTSLPERLRLAEGESLAAVVALDDERDAGRYLLIATAGGWLHRLRTNYVGPHLQPGARLYDPGRGGGPPAALALVTSEVDVLLALRSGSGIRFAQTLIRREGVPGIQIAPGDAVVGLAGVRDEDAALLVSNQGKGIRREMDSFRANKSPGGQGKALLKADDLAGVVAVAEGDEVLCLSEQAKVIRFAAAEVSTTAGSVQGNSLMDCRGSRLVSIVAVSSRQRSG